MRIKNVLITLIACTVAVYAVDEPAIFDDFSKLSNGGKTFYERIKDKELDLSRKYTTKDRMDSHNGKFEIVKVMDGENGDYYLWHIDHEKNMLFIKKYLSHYKTIIIYGPWIFHK
jgi:hypothetical protein